MTIVCQPRNSGSFRRDLYFPDLEDLYVGASRERLYLLLDPALIFFIANNFRTQNQGPLNGALMHHTLGSFAT